LIAAGISVVIIGSVNEIGTSLNAKFSIANVRFWLKADMS
jgi:Flp pilus assembly pilin Flp